MNFNYQARDSQGRTQIGVVEASSREAALKLLSRQGLFVTILQEQAKQPLFARRIPFFDRIHPKEIMLFSKELSILFKSQVSLIEALQTIAMQTRQSVLKEKILRISQDVEGGTLLSEALGRHPDVFSSYYVSMVKSGETSGSLSFALESLSEHLERQYALNSKIKSALAYPIFVILVGVAVLGVVMFFVMPNLTKVLAEVGRDLPAATKLVIGLTGFLRSYWFFLLGGLVGLVAVLRLYTRTPNGKKLIDETLLQLPILGNVLRQMYVARFAENLAMLVKGGIPIVQALEITKAVLGNRRYQDVIEQAKETVKKGGSISDILRQYPEEFPPLFVQLIMVGEKTGTLEIMLKDIVGFYEKEVTNAIDAVLSLLEPVLIVVMGVLVGGLMGAVLLPLYQIISF